MSWLCLVCLGISVFHIFDHCVQVCARMNAENEASLLSALTEILDSVDVETLSPFDTLPDSDIFSPQTGPVDTVSFHVDSLLVIQAQLHGSETSYSCLLIVWNSFLLQRLFPDPKISQSLVSKSGKVSFLCVILLQSR